MIRENRQQAQINIHTNKPFLSQAVCGVEVRILTIHVPLRVKLYSKFNFIYISLENLPRIQR